MAYSTTEEVNRLLGPHKATVTTPVTIEDVDALRESVSYQIDAVLVAAGISSVPVTDETFSNYLGTIESWGAAAHTLKALFPEAIGAGEQPAFAYWQKLFDDALENLPGLIPSALMGARDNASGYFTENPDEDVTVFVIDQKDEYPW